MDEHRTGMYRHEFHAADTADKNRLIFMSMNRMVSIGMFLCERHQDKG